MAIAARGLPRATKDLDFLINADEDFFTKEFIKKLNNFGYAAKIYKGDIDDPLRGLIRILDNSGEPLVELILIHWQWQEDVINSADKLILGDVSIPIAKAEDLAILKLKAGSQQDLLDAQELIKSAFYAGKLDKDRLSLLAKKASVNKKLDKLLALAKQG